ncbi:Ger(x)C family spore germination protein [Caloranaerobacter azorensis]|uniref:Ger(X)C family spore germination protein n=1 Tax=Caloranaerobacter azorensis TaxID=116090 RepID=A0A6P1YES6_9FIRM|nr:Ger(x)C family spore germination protein [Caloranaerobacter azorensis]QIB27731.1 Ger(x)C family spore germination protein [Caloranaerobacter azorensis]
MSKFGKMIIIFMSVAILSGCWDKVEINDRAFISAIGIDIQGQGGELEKNKTGYKKFIVTFVFPNVKAIRKGSSGEEPRFILSSVGQNIFHVSNALTTRSNKTMFFGHTKAIIIGEKVARDSDSLKQIFDEVERAHEMGRKVGVFISQGEARRVINIEPSLESVTGTYLAALSKAKEKSSRFTPKTIGDILPSLHDCRCVLIPRIIPTDKGIKVAGAAVIKDYKLIGWLGEIENRSVMFITDKVTSEAIIVMDDDVLVSYVISDTSVSRNGRMENGQIVMDITVDMEGVLQQYKLEAKNDVLNNKLLRRLEGLVEKKIKSEIDGTIKKIQKEFEVDVIGIAEYLYKFKPDIWDKVKDDWEDVFPEVKINVNVNTKIRRIGMTK